MFENSKYISCGKFISDGTWTHPDRTLDSYETIFVTKGCVYINEGGCNYVLQAGEALVLRPKVRHYGYRPGSDTEFFWFHWSDGSLITLEDRHRKVTDAYMLSVYYRQLIQYRVENKPSECFDYLIRLILSELYYNSSDPKTNHTAYAVAAWIKANSHTTIKASDIAKQFGYNVDYLNRLFKANFSSSLKEFIDEERMKHIKAIMLADNLRLNEIAQKCGFSEYKYFLKFFKYHEGITPTQFYRQSAKLYINTR